jgi:hypothetical protein
MERRRDYRQELEYALSLKCPRTRRVLDGLSTEDVSASGLRFRSGAPHGLSVGDRLELQLVARIPGRKPEDDRLVMATCAVVVRVEEHEGALRFEAPLAY